MAVNPLFSGAAAFLRGSLHQLGKNLTIPDNSKTENDVKVQARLVELGYAEWVVNSESNLPELKYLDKNIEYVFTGVKNKKKQNKEVENA